MEGRNHLFKNVYPANPAVASVIKDTEDEDKITDDSVVFEEECNMPADEAADHANLGDDAEDTLLSALAEECTQVYAE